MKVRILSLVVVCFVAFAIAPVIAPVVAQKVGGFSPADVKSPEVIAAAEFAVKEQAAKDKTKLKLQEIEKAESQVVAGINYRLALKIADGDAVREADAVVWKKLDKTHKLTSWAWRPVKKAE